MKIIVDGKETSAEDFRTKRDGRVIASYEIDKDNDQIVVKTAPPVSHLPHTTTDC